MFLTRVSGTLLPICIYIYTYVTWCMFMKKTGKRGSCVIKSVIHLKYSFVRNHICTVYCIFKLETYYIVNTSVSCWKMTSFSCDEWHGLLRISLLASPSSLLEKVLIIIYIYYTRCRCTPRLVLVTKHACFHVSNEAWNQTNLAKQVDSYQSIA